MHVTSEDWLVVGNQFRAYTFRTNACAQSPMCLHKHECVEQDVHTH